MISETNSPGCSHSTGSGVPGYFAIPIGVQFTKPEAWATSFCRSPATTEKWGTATEMSNHPVFRLSDGAGALGILTTSSDTITATDPWSLRVELDALDADAVLEKVRIRNARGKVVLERRLHEMVPKGLRAIELLDFPAGALKIIGQYTIEEVAGINGRTRVIARLR